MRQLPIGARKNGRSIGVPSTVVADRRMHSRLRIAAARHVVERAAVFAQRHLAIGAAVDVVEDDPRQSTLGKAAKSAMLTALETAIAALF